MASDRVGPARSRTTGPRWSGRTRGRAPAGSAALVAALVAVTLTGCDHDKPAPAPVREEVQRAVALPAPVGDRPPGVIAGLPVEPAVVDDRLRVMGKGDRLWAEPLAGATGAAPVWSYRRVGARIGAFRIIRDGTGRTLAVTAWDESPDRYGPNDTGLLVGVDLATGAPAWRSVVPHPVSSTGEGVTPRSDDLLVVPARGGPVAVLPWFAGVEAVDATSGKPLWRYDQHKDCAEVPDFGPGSWELGGYLVLDITCKGGKRKPQLRVFDARSARITAYVQPKLPRSGGPEPAVYVSGCTDGNGCAVFGVSTGPAEVERPLAWRLDRDGRPVRVTTDRDSYCCLQHDGRFLLLASTVIALTPDLHARWRVAAGAEHRGLYPPVVEDVDQGTDLVWLAASSWREGPAALVGLDPATGAVRTCAAPPRAVPVRSVDAQGKYLVVRDDPNARTPPTGTYVLIRPDTRPHPCPAS